MATDQGFLNKSKIVWETLSNIDGDVSFCDSNFRINLSHDDKPLAKNASNDVSQNLKISETNE